MAVEEAMDTTELSAAQEGDLSVQVISRYKNSVALEHRHLCAVVAAMAEVIKEQGVPPTPTAYFAATMSALDRQHSSNLSHESDDHVTTALCTFLAITLPKISPPVVRSKSSPCLMLLITIISSGKLSSGGLKPAFNCVVAFLEAADTADWLGIAPAFNILLNYCSDQRPKVRKRAHECSADALRKFQNSASRTMASEAVVSLFERSFLAVSQNKGRNSADKAAGKSGTTEALQILYLLNALKLLLPLLSGKSIGKVLSIFNKLLDLEQPFLSRQIFNTLQPLCTDLNAEIPAAALSNLLERLAAMIVEEKKAGDESMVAARILVKGMEKLYSLDSQSCALKLPLIFQSLAGMLAFEQEEAVYAAADSLKSLIQTCLDNSIIEQGKVALQSRGNSLNLTPSSIERICVTASSLLGYQFSPAWDVCLQVVACLFEKLGDASFQLMASSVQALAELEGLSDENLPCRRQLHKTIGSAISAMGPEKFLKLLPLSLEGEDISNSRLWLVPVLRQNIVGAELSFFSEKILPLIQRLQNDLKKLSMEGKATASKKMEAVVQSLWSLFPAFCNFPSDTAQSFGRMAKHMGAILSEESDLRGVICHGLQMLIRQNRGVLGELVNVSANTEDYVGVPSTNKAAEERAKTLYTEKIARANIVAIASFSRNFLPLLFNVFISAPPEKRGVLQSTIGDVASISQKKVVKDFFISIMQKLLKATKEAGDNTHLKGIEPMDISGPGKEESVSSKRCIFMDLALSLLRGLDDESVSVLFTAAKPTLQDNDGSVQKKGYKVLAGLCKEHTGFLAGRCNDVLELMLMAMPSCHFSAKRQRLNCLHPLILHIFRSQDQNSDKVLSSFIGEIVLATKETNIKTRNTAYDILVQLGRSLKETDPLGYDGKLIQFFTMIVGCLAGSTPHMRSAAITGLARLIYEFHDLCQTIPELLPSVLLLLQTKSREVIKSVLGFLKVVVARQPVEHLQQHLKSIVEGLLLWSDDSKNHFKAKIRVLFEMLVRKCGLQAVSAVTPEQHVKLLNHIRKMRDRKEKTEGDDSKSVKSHTTTGRQSRWQQTQFFSDDDDGVGSDDNNTDQLTIASAWKSRATTTRSNRRLRKATKMLPEDEWDGETEPLDLLDMQKTRSVLSNNKLKRKNYDSDDLEVDPDGRLIVPDESTDFKERTKDSKDQDVDMRSTKSGKSANKLKPKAHATKKRKTETGWAYTGQEYSNKKGAGRGDVKRQGKLDPYAYWPLDPKMLNRREGKKAVARKGLASVVKVTNKMKGLSASEALGLKHSLKESRSFKSSKGKQKFHKSKGKGKRK
ncbi:hypothetical protein GOP47_0020845 [Adiantum capillus-veneris]|uniref:Ribosomal RNA-processing protein 12-like conserved domain-containing protein n=1 Tax=Adiantum capillus-veneris TaxID=13818 RepID=A0A9D4UA62_ADICA|nr:hypothetical protein GOP47_0020845 [Adiantum capillus-veneris]